MSGWKKIRINIVIEISTFSLLSKNASNAFAPVPHSAPLSIVPRNLILSTNTTMMDKIYTSQAQASCIRRLLLKP